MPSEQKRIQDWANQMRFTVVGMHFDRKGQEGGPMNDLECCLYEQIRVTELNLLIHVLVLRCKQLGCFN